MQPAAAEDQLRNTTAAQDGPAHSQPRRPAETSGASYSWITPDTDVNLGLVEGLMEALKGRLSRK